jgi:hypothetical protein
MCDVVLLAFALSARNIDINAFVVRACGNTQRRTRYLGGNLVYASHFERAGGTRAVVG